MAFRSSALAAILGGALAACGGAEKLSARCEVMHTLTAGDTVETRIERLTDTWAVTFRMRVRLDENEAPLEIHGLGRASSHGRDVHCEIVDPGAGPGAPRFDDALCLDELESVIDLIQDAEDAARPGETVVQEVRLRVRRRHARSRVAARATSSFQERAEVERDSAGRVIHLVRSTVDGGREEVRVIYPSGADGRCLPAPP